MPDLEARSLRMMGIALLDDMAGPVVWRRLVFVISYWGQVWGDLNIVSRVRSECNGKVSGLRSLQGSSSVSMEISELVLL